MKKKINNVWIHIVNGSPCVTVWREKKNQHYYRSKSGDKATRLRRAQWMQQQLIKDGE